MKMACACIYLAENLFGGYSNVSLHFAFTMLFHQITHLILGGRTICDEAVEVKGKRK